jgi:hypothetical protein
MSVDNSNRDKISPFLTTKNFYIKKDDFEVDLDFETKTIRKKPSKKMALKFEKIELEDNLEKQKLYEMKLTSINHKIERMKQERNRTKNIFANKQLATKNEINSLKNDLVDFEKMNHEKENNLVILKNSINKHKEILDNYLTQDVLASHEEQKISLQSKKAFLKNIKETIFNSEINLNELKNKCSNLDQDKNNVEEEIKREKIYAHDLVDKQNILRAGIKGIKEFNKMNSQVYEETIKIYKEKKEDYDNTQTQIKFYKNKLMEKISDKENLHELNKEEVVNKKVFNSNFKSISEKELSLKQDMNNIRQDTLKLETEVLDKKQILMEKEFLINQNEEHLAYQKEFLVSLEKILKKNIETFSEFLEQNYQVVDQLENTNYLDSCLISIKKDISSASTLIN